MHDVIDTQDGNIVIGHAQYGFTTNFFRVKFDNIEQLSNKVNINIDMSAKLSPREIYYGYKDYRENAPHTLTDPAVANVSFEIINYGPSYETIKGSTQSEAPYTLVPVQEFNSDIIPESIERRTLWIIGITNLVLLVMQLLPRYLCQLLFGVYLIMNQTFIKLAFINCF